MITGDIITVKYYLMTGSKPDTEVDTYIGYSEVHPDSSLAHSAIVTLPAGTHNLYAIAIDRLGNVSRNSRPVQFEVQA